MKGLLIGIAIFVVGAIYALTSFPSVGSQIVQKVALEEKGRDAVVEAEVKDEKAFVVRYRPLLDRRWSVGQAALFLDDDYFLALSKETLDLYKETLMENELSYGLFMFERAKMIEATMSNGGAAVLGESFELYKAYVARFPATKQAKLAQNAINRLTVKYGFQ